LQVNEKRLFASLGVSVRPSVRLSVRLEELSSHRTNFIKCYISRLANLSTNSSMNEL